MTKTIYITTVFDMEPWTDYGNACGPAFATREAAEKFLEEHKGKVYGEGYFKWDEATGEMVECDKSDPDSWYDYGWSYGSYIEEVEFHDY